MHKTISLFIILALAVSIFGPNLGIAEEFETNMTEAEVSNNDSDSNGNTGSTGSGQDGSADLEQTSSEEGEPEETEEENGESDQAESLFAPKVKAVWAMKGYVDELSGQDDSQEAGAQFLPSGQYQVSKPISACAVVSDQNGKEDIDSVSGEIYYPMLMFEQDGDDQRFGCGQEKEKCQMFALEKQEGIELFCQNIQQNNSNLPEFYDIYGFSNICGEEGGLAEEKASIYCCNSELFYDDISGDYQFSVSAKDSQEIESNVLSGEFTYLKLTAYEADFTALSYGKVTADSRKVIEGDLIWNEPKGENQMTVRNVGNTRLQLKIEQNDMGLGKTDGDWNVRYGARLGGDSLWQNYWPEESVLLEKVLELSGKDRLDFSVEVFRFPKSGIKNHTGTMSINARETVHQSCFAI